ncbi:MAG: hypothetical protein V1809_01615 [Planctomycetota bacterium]
MAKPRSPEFDKFVAEKKRVLIILWLAFLAAPFAYIGIAFFLMKEHPPVDQKFLVVLGAMSVFSGIGSLVIPWVLFSENRLRAWLRKDPGESAVRCAPFLSDMQSLAPAEQRVALLLARYQMGFMFTMALAEGVAIYGLVAVVIGASRMAYLFFGIPSILLVAAQRPQVDRLLENLESLEPIEPL